MLIQVSCPCGKKYLEREDALGHGSACPACGHVTHGVRASAKAPAEAPPDPAKGELVRAAGPAAPPPASEPRRPTGGSRLEDDPQGWQQVLQFRQAQRRLRKVSYGNIALGVLTCAVGAFTMQQIPVNGLLLALGGMLIFEGAVLALRSTPWDLAVEGLILLFVGVWNIVVTAGHCADSVSAGSGLGDMRFVGAGIVLFFYGCVNLAHYPRLSSFGLERPTPETLRKADRLLAALASANPAVDPTVLEFDTKACGWRARLRGDVGLFAALDGSVAFVAEKSTVEVEDMGKIFLSSARRATFWVGTQKFQGSIASDDLERFRRWKGAAPAQAAGEFLPAFATNE